MIKELLKNIYKYFPLYAVPAYYLDLYYMNLNEVN